MIMMCSAELSEKCIGNFCLKCKCNHSNILNVGSQDYDIF